ncbi:glycosyltransferase family 2 protein [Methylobacterium sp. WSM2598]|uniref:glycosyltransferase family 2 protein n=1 Tax=Methylobacterium sp. WSM2598 TaxID=398261 RepID=UPI00036C9E44|nr:glycosyltransferase family 2 protein [Methylobacterium sp. WSM2598]
MTRARRFPPSPALDALRFAEPLRGSGRDALAALPGLLAHPREALAIGWAWLTGKRVRARNRAAALLGAHPRLRPRPVAGAPAARAAAPAGHGPVILCPEGHCLAEGAAAAVAEAFAGDPGLRALYGDALVLGPGDRPLLPLLRPAFDPDFLLAVDYVGPVVALRDPVRGEAGDDVPALLLRLHDRHGPGAVRHLPRVLSLWRPFAAASGDASRQARRALARARAPEAGIETGPCGVLTLRRPLPEPPLVSLIVPTRDRLDLLRTCLDSLRARTDWPGLDIIVCDNDSREPETLAYLRALEEAGAARVLPCPGPFNFAAMNNRAAGIARGRLLGFVNNDVEAFRPDWLRRMAEEALRPEVGAVGAKLLDAVGRVQHGGIVLGTGGLVTHAHRHFPGDAPGYLHRLAATHRVAAVTAACLVVEARKFAEVGGFDEAAFAVDFNDVDLCLRLDRAGYRTLIVPGAVLHHREAASRRWTPEAARRHAAEVASLRARWGAALAADPWYHPAFDPQAPTYTRLRPAPGAGPR